jgi:hypothetical protein
VPPRRIRRPLLALILLVVVLVAGYIWQAARSDGLPATRSIAAAAARATAGLAPLRPPARQTRLHAPRVAAR